MEKNPLVKSISLVALVVGAFITIGTFFFNIHQYFYNDVFIANNISNQVEKLSAGQDIEYFRKYLGSQILQRKVNSEFTEYVFNYKNAYIQTLVEDSNDEVIYWAITYCGQNPVMLERPVFSMGGSYKGVDAHGNEIVEMFLAPKLYLNQSTFTDFLKEEEGHLKIFISAATANSFAYEAVSFGNPSAYQTIIVGINDTCSIEGLYDHLDADDHYLKPEEQPNKEAVARFRQNIKINTYAETAPFRGEEVINLLDSIHSENFSDPYLNFGVDRIRVRYFPENQ